MASAGGDWKDFYCAAERGDSDCVRYHLCNGVDVNYQHPEVMVSALVAACGNGHSAVVQLLLEHGAHPHLPAELGGTTPLQAAQRHGHTSVAQILLQHGACHTSKAPMPWWQRWLPGL